MEEDGEVEDGISDLVSCCSSSPTAANEDEPLLFVIKESLGRDGNCDARRTGSTSASGYGGVGGAIDSRPEVV